MQRPEIAKKVKEIARLKRHSQETKASPSCYALDIAIGSSLLARRLTEASVLSLTFLGKGLQGSSQE